MTKFPRGRFKFSSGVRSGDCGELGKQPITVFKPRTAAEPTGLFLFRPRSLELLSDVFTFGRGRMILKGHKEVVRKRMGDGEWLEEGS